MPPVGFEPTISAGERPQTYDLGRAATGTGFFCSWLYIIMADLFSYRVNELDEDQRVNKGASLSELRLFCGWNLCGNGDEALYRSLVRSDKSFLFMSNTLKRIYMNTGCRKSYTSVLSTSCDFLYFTVF